MANPIKFKLEPIDPRRELQKRLDDAPIEHAEAMLVVYDIIQSAHDNGTLDLINGLVGGRDMIAGELAKAAKLPGGVATIRNLMALSKILMALDPDALDEFTKHLVTATGQHKAEEKPPSLWAIGKRMFSDDSRRAFSFLTLMLGAVGKSLKPTSDSAHH